MFPFCSYSKVINIFFMKRYINLFIQNLRMENDDLRIQHIIILTALFVSLLGTLLILDKINEEPQSITGATAMFDSYEKEQEIRVMRVTGINETNASHEK